MNVEGIKKEGRVGIFNPNNPESVFQHSYAAALIVDWTMYNKFLQSVLLLIQYILY